jgi:hypothetical protein
VPSYSPVFSAPFLIYTDAAPNYTFEVPTAYTAVIRDFNVFCEVGGVAASVYIQDSEDAPACTVAFLQAEGALSYEQWQGRVVVPGGGLINLYVSSIDLETSAYVGGYLLRNTLS